ncbi:Uncharacterised protein [Escherichia coli]|nr:Uncharacterised protein [Escherichia coli]
MEVLLEKFNKKQRIYLYQFCADMLHSGLPIYDSIVKLRSEGEALLGKSFAKRLDYLMERMKNSPSVSASFGHPDSDRRVKCNYCCGE